MDEEPKQVGETNPKFPETNPASHQDFSYLEMVMELSKSMAQMTERVESLREASKSQGDKLNKVAKDVHSAKVVVWLVGGILAIIGSVLVWFMNQGMQILRPIIQDAIQ